MRNWLEGNRWFHPLCAFPVQVFGVVINTRKGGEATGGKIGSKRGGQIPLLPKKEMIANEACPGAEG